MALSMHENAGPGLTVRADGRSATRWRSEQDVHLLRAEPMTAGLVVTLPGAPTCAAIRAVETPDHFRVQAA